jgi:hypothetical protein
MLVVIIVLPLAFYVLVRAGVQPGANFLARQFGGTDAVTLPRGLVQAFALVAAVYGAAVDIRMLVERARSRRRDHRLSGTRSSALCADR